MGSVVLVMGVPGSGKTTLAKKVYPNHYRINRDETGGSLEAQATRVAEACAQGNTNIVLDNTFLTKRSRKPVIDAARQAGKTVEVVWLKTTLPDAQVNACLRMLEQYGRLLSDDDIQKEKIKNPGIFPNKALYAAVKSFEMPELAEGIDRITEVPFVREWGPEYVNRAFIFDYDDTIRELPSGHDGEKYPTSIEHIVIKNNRKQVLEYLKYTCDDYYFLGASNQSGIAKGTITDKIARDCFDETHRLLGMELQVLYCPHASGPPSCFCRKPHPGMLVSHIWKYKLDPKHCVFVGDQTSDRTCAQRVGMAFEHESTFFTGYAKEIEEG